MKNLHKNIGIFATSLLAASSAVYLYSPVIGSHADSSATADINVTVGEVMNLTLDTDSLNLNTTPNNFVSGTINATVSTNSQYGYTLTLEDVDDNTNMVHTNENVSAVVTSGFEGTKTSATMDNNTWGFSLDATDFSKIPVNGSAATLKKTTTPMATASETTPVTFGAKVGNLTSGTYTDKVLFTIYTNGQNEPDDMQSFSCDSMAVNEKTTLIDSRDGSDYEVVKLADGKCWMTQNLRLVGPLTLTSENSNVVSSWEMPAQPSGGDYDYGWVSGSSSSASSYNLIEYIDSEDEQIGVYYNYYVATAGTISGVYNSNEATSSICPKGWKMPSNQEFQNMFSATGAVANDIWNMSIVQGDPLNYGRGGYWELSGPTPTDVEVGGVWHTTTPYDDNYRKDITTSQSTVYQNFAGDRRRGYLLRCVTQ